MPQNSEKPMITQYKRIKEQYLDAILMFRVGNFYQMYYNDAQVAHDVLGLKLISRNIGHNVMIPMCGVPASAIERMSQELCNTGFRVAICDQVSDETDEELGITARKVARVFEPVGQKTDLTAAWTKFMSEHTFEPTKRPSRKAKGDDILTELREIRFEETTPAEAFRILYRWKQKYCPDQIIG